MLDHFKAYVTDGPFIGDQVFVQDQFDTAPQQKTVGQPFRFMNPVQKTHGPVITPITNPDTHLEIYYLLPAGPYATRYVQVANQFGIQAITVFDSVGLGVPTQKNGIGVAHDVDHFRFYRAFGNPVNATVDLLDQFHLEPNVPVMWPRYFANPVQKVHNGIVTPINHPTDHLVCYEIQPQPWSSTITTLNQFGAGTLIVDPADLLCVPSDKLSWSTPTPAPTPTPTPTPPTPTPTPTPDPTPPQVVLDHFKAYVTDGPTVGDQVFLRDQFDTQPQPKVVGQPFRFANPVQKIHGPVITPITNVDTHLEFYYLLPPEPPVTRYVQISNQFGPQNITVGDPVALAVPTRKNGVGFIHDVDHFKFYRATGLPINVTVDLIDQFHLEQNVDVLQPRYFGNPVEKLHNGMLTPITHPNDHLVCYEIPPQPWNSTVTTLNQFGPGTLPIQPADLLCVPTDKISWAFPTPTPPPGLNNISGTLPYCFGNPNPNPVPGVTLTLSGSASATTMSDGLGNYQFSSLPSGGSYTVTPTKSALAPSSPGINTVDVIAAQRHFLNLGTPMSGCRLMAADVNGANGVNTVDVIAIQRFFLGLSTGLANVGKYNFNPPSRTYPDLSDNQTGQNYSVLIFGDVALGSVHRPTGTSSDAPGDLAAGDEAPASVANVALPNVRLDQSKANLPAAVTTSLIDQKSNLVGFQGDFTFDSRAIIFDDNPVQKAGLTDRNWNVSGNVLPETGPIKTLRVSAYSTDLAPLSGNGILFELKMAPTIGGPSSTQLLWALPPDHFIFIDSDLRTQRPVSTSSGAATRTKPNRGR